jgi:hypothetical protein
LLLALRWRDEKNIISFKYPAFDCFFGSLHVARNLLNLIQALWLSWFQIELRARAWLERLLVVRAA